ncbi:unnamed protein product [Owenia fusiformis]|uniref:Splicing factor YJU2 n=1 Tax=Owenia fusiformis TaxID=6347 RepID=A0A8J1TCW7_OWEFU|nr:unnamed protein product [Owenia fusiformis]
MSERKVLNKYYPPDFDPAKVPRLKQAKNRQFTIRTMAPFNMRCSTCGEYIYKGKKFNSRSERVLDEDYLGLHIHRFYIRCPKCVSEITFKTDPENCDYKLENGAIRNFEAFTTAQKLEEKKIQEAKDEEANNPMLALENRTKASRNEIEALENLGELRDQNSRHAKVDLNELLEKKRLYEEHLQKLQDDEDEKFVNSVFGRNGNDSLKRLHDDSSSDEEEKKSSSKVKKITNVEKPTDFLSEKKTEQKTESWQKSVGSLKKSSLSGLVKKKKTVAASATSATAASDTSNTVADSDTNSTTQSNSDNRGDQNQINNELKSDETSKTQQNDQNKNNSEVKEADVGYSDKEVADIIKSASTLKKKDATENKKSPKILGGLGFLGVDYSDSDSNDDSD